MTTEQKLELFIENNNLTFQEGTRNTDSVVISGYALHLGVTEVDTIIDAIKKQLVDKNPDYHDELPFVFSFAQKNNYGKWWEKPVAKKTYKF